MCTIIFRTYLNRNKKYLYKIWDQIIFLFSRKQKLKSCFLKIPLYKLYMSELAFSLKCTSGYKIKYAVKLF